MKKKKKKKKAMINGDDEAPAQPLCRVMVMDGS